MLVILYKRRANALNKEALILVLEEKIAFKRRRKTSIKLADFDLVKPIEFIT